MLYPFFAIIDIILGAFKFFIIAQVIISWLIVFNVVNTYQPVVRSIIEFLYKITEPTYARVRRFLPNLGGVDLAPFVVLLLVYFVQMLFRFTLAPMVGVYF